MSVFIYQLFLLCFRLHVVNSHFLFRHDNFIFLGILVIIFVYSSECNYFKYFICLQLHSLITVSIFVMVVPDLFLMLFWIK